jgi:hypothetical protein
MCTLTKTQRKTNTLIIEIAGACASTITFQGPGNKAGGIANAENVDNFSEPFHIPSATTKKKDKMLKVAKHLANIVTTRSLSKNIESFFAV